MDGVSTINGVVDLVANGLTGIFAGCQMQLTATTFVPGRATLPADLPVPTFTGYAVKPVVWDAPGWSPGDGKAKAVGTATYQWTGPSDGTGQSIVGWGLVQPGAAGPPVVPNDVLASGILDVPVTLLLPTDKLTLTVEVDSNGVVTVTQL